MERRILDWAKQIAQGIRVEDAGWEVYYISGDQWLVRWNFAYDGESRHGSWDFFFAAREANPNNEDARAIQRQ